jgi:hypothetical protein
MRKLVCVLLVIVLCGCAAHESNEPHNVRLRFAPDDPSLTVAGSVSWGRLGGSPGGAALIRTPLGGEFPIRDEDGRIHFKATLVGGDDDHLVVELRSENGSQRIEVQRDKPVTVRVAESKYELSYPSSYVSSADIPTEENAYAPIGAEGQTNIATLFVKHLP